jgi:branched-chain amino acid transport system permease protein
MTDLVGILITAVVLGSIYGLVAIGMSLVYGTLRILDMSQGSMVMLGMYVAWGVLVVAHWNPVFALVLAFIATFVVGS